MGPFDVDGDVSSFFLTPQPNDSFISHYMGKNHPIITWNKKIF